MGHRGDVTRGSHLGHSKLKPCCWELTDSTIYAYGIKYEMQWLEKLVVEIELYGR